MSYTHAIFDLDGTIIDSAEGIVRSVEYALSGMGVTEYDKNGLRRFIGPPLVDAFMRFIGLTEEEAKQAVAHYRERYSVTGIHECSVYPGIAELLSELKNAGVKLYIGSSKPLPFVEKILFEHGIYDFFDVISGATLDGRIDTKEQVLLDLLEKSDIDKGSAVMVGDRYHDIEGAHALGLPVIAVLYGFGSREEFNEYGAEYIAEDTEQIFKIITNKEV